VTSSLSDDHLYALVVCLNQKLYNKEEVTVMNDFFKTLIEESGKDWETINSKFRKREYAPKTTLLFEGDQAEFLYLIQNGSVRLWFNDNGKDITVQFFFEDQMVSSFESLYRNEPSLLNIETIEETTLYLIKKEDLFALIDRYPRLKDMQLQIVSSRFIYYLTLFLSRISKSPQERYLELLQESPQIIHRIPHHYIASYLGITPVSLSRIRKRISDY